MEKLGNLYSLKFKVQGSQLVAAVDEGAEEPREAQAEADAEEEKRKHSLTHEPYAPWCTNCISGKGR